MGTGGDASVLWAVSVGVVWDDIYIFVVCSILGGLFIFRIGNGLVVQDAMEVHWVSASMETGVSDDTVEGLSPISKQVMMRGLDTVVNITR